MQTFEFEGKLRTFREINELVGGRKAIPPQTLRNRLAAGQKTVAEVLRPVPRVAYRAWNQYEARK